MRGADARGDGRRRLTRALTNRSWLKARQRLDVHRLEQPDPHHLGDPAGVVAIAFVDRLVPDLVGFAADYIIPGSTGATRRAEIQLLTGLGPPVKASASAS